MILDWEFVFALPIVCSLLLDLLGLDVDFFGFTGILPVFTVGEYVAPARYQQAEAGRDCSLSDDTCALHTLAQLLRTLPWNFLHVHL